MRSRFDRLPPRFERLLERIEMGRNVRANLRRLERALASASPELRRRVLRLLGAEIARLRRAGVTPAERRRIARLQQVRRELTHRTGPGTTGVASTSARSPSSSSSAPAPNTGTPAAAGPGGQVQAGPREDTGVLSAQAGGGIEQPRVGPVPIPSLPDDGDKLPFALGLALLALLVLAFVGVVVGVTNHVLGRARSG
jgi:hypothetical protein